MQGVNESDRLVFPVYVVLAVVATAVFAFNAAVLTTLLVALSFVAIGVLLFTRLGLWLAGGIDGLNGYLGRGLAWAILLAVVVSAINAVVRKVFNASSNAWLELQWVLFGLVFLWCSPWTLLDNEHIRIDIVNSYFPKRLRDWIDVFGHVVFLIPFCVVMIITGLPFARRTAPSWQDFAGSFSASPLNWLSEFLRTGEQSLSAGGLPQWPAKTLIPLAFALLLAQGISELIKRIAILQGRMDDPHGVQHSAAELEAERLLQLAEADGDARPISEMKR
jgi:TRAP-type mannitol/chloroaromatic compound transport system permease small subunit